MNGGESNQPTVREMTRQKAGIRSEYEDNPLRTHDRQGVHANRGNQPNAMQQKKKKRKSKSNKERIQVKKGKLRDKEIRVMEYREGRKMISYIIDNQPLPKVAN